MPRKNKEHSRASINRPLIGINKLVGRTFEEDIDLEIEADRAARSYVRNLPKETEYLEGYSNFGKGPRNYHRSDERIREDVCQALYESHDVDASGIDVDVKDHCVYLKGQVKDRFTKRLSEAAVENIAGVFDVQNELTFIRQEPTVGRRLTDDERELVDKMS